MEDVQLLLVCEGDIVHGDLALDVGQGLRVGLVLDGGLGAHDGDEAVQTGEAVGEHLGEAGQLTHGRNEVGDVQGEGDQIDVVHLALHDVVAAEADDHHVQAAQEELHGAVETAHGLVEAALGVLEQVIGGMETVMLHLLVGEGLGSADAGEAGLDLLVDVAGLLLGLAGCLGHGAAHGHDHDQEDGDHQAHDHRQLPLDGAHDHQCANDGQHGSDHILGAVVSKLRQLEQVRGQTGHQLAGAVLIVEVEAHGLHLGKQVAADIRLDTDAEDVAEVGDDEVQQGPETVAQQCHHHDDEEGAVHLIGQHLIEGCTGDQGEGQVHACDEHGAGDIHQEQLPMLSEIAQKDQQRITLKILGFHNFLPPYEIVHTIIQHFF